MCRHPPATFSRDFNRPWLGCQNEDEEQLRNCTKWSQKGAEGPFPRYMHGRGEIKTGADHIPTKLLHQRTTSGLRYLYLPLPFWLHWPSLERAADTFTTRQRYYTSSVGHPSAVYISCSMTCVKHPPTAKGLGSTNEETVPTGQGLSEMD